MTIEVIQENGITVEVFTSQPSKSFNRVAVDGQDTVEADGANELLTLIAGAGIDITTDESTNTITFTSVIGGEIDGGTDD